MKRTNIFIGAAMAALITGAALAEEDGSGVRTVMPGPLEAVAEPEPLQMPGTTPEANAAQYCGNIADAAADARFALQAKAIEEMRAQLEEQIVAVEAKRAEYEAWLKRREEFAAQAEESVVSIYSQMRPDAAALQIAVMNPGSAAAILAKLTPRTASAILNEMDPAAAAQLAATIAGLANRPPVKEQQG
jgi:flagellar motility protein MotE (MotC chaperone)